MTTRDLVLELKNTIKDLLKEKADMAKTIEHKESRNKQILIKLEQANNDVDHVGKHSSRIKQENDELQLKVSTLKAKLETTQELLKLAKEKLKDYEPDPEETLTSEDVEHIEDSDQPELRSVASEKYNKFGDEEE